MNFGLYDPLFREHKIKKKKAFPVGPHVMLDQERCILCSRCVRFTDEISKSGEFGIFNRGDRAEVALYPGEQLDNPYSGNVVDICPVGALTDREFRFKARVWYLSSAPSVCDRCAQGCNVDVHYVLDRPHLNDGARILRVKPRYNPDVNQWWMCDEGRYGFGWVDSGRLTKVRRHGADATWEQAVEAVTDELKRVGAQDREPGAGSRIGVIASPQLTNEELFLIREIFQRALGARVTASCPTPAGYSDGFLISGDKHPNTQGARLMGLMDPPGLDATTLVADALEGRLDVLWVFGHDLTKIVAGEKLDALSGSLRLVVFSGTSESPTASRSHWTLPTAAYLEKDGTFVNRHGRVQRIGRAFAPLPDSREDWSVLLEIAARLQLGFGWRSPQDVFQGLAESVASFGGLTYERIGFNGAPLATAAPVAEAIAR
jgi:NADH-quinone oxidoreductase subunit G